MNNKTVCTCGFEILVDSNKPSDYRKAQIKCPICGYNIPIKKYIPKIKKTR